jgi:dihydrofolate reductase
MPHTFILIAAVCQNGVIGQAGGLPFHLPADLARFKALTTGKTVLMGRKTYESLPPAFRPLPHRRNIVLTRQKGWKTAGAETIHALIEAPEGEVWVIGGGDLYAQTLPLATRLELTEVHAAPKGDTFFPAFDKSQWKEVARTPHPAQGDYPAFDFVTYGCDNSSR